MLGPWVLTTKHGVRLGFIFAISYKSHLTTQSYLYCALCHKSHLKFLQTDFLCHVSSFSNLTVVAQVPAHASPRLLWLLSSL